MMSKPYCRLSGSMPTAEQTEYRPPTQSQKAKAFSGSMPNSLTSFRLVETATMCLETASFPNSAVSHVLQSVSSSALCSAMILHRVQLTCFCYMNHDTGPLAGGLHLHRKLAFMNDIKSWNSWQVSKPAMPKAASRVTQGQVAPLTAQCGRSA